MISKSFLMTTIVLFSIVHFIACVTPPTKTNTQTATRPARGRSTTSSPVGNRNVPQEKTKPDSRLKNNGMPVQYGNPSKFASPSVVQKSANDLTVNGGVGNTNYEFFDTDEEEDDSDLYTTKIELHQNGIQTFSVMPGSEIGQIGSYKSNSSKKFVENQLGLEQKFIVENNSMIEFYHPLYRSDQEGASHSGRVKIGSQWIYGPLFKLKCTKLEKNDKPVEVEEFNDAKKEDTMSVDAESQLRTPSTSMRDVNILLKSIEQLLSDIKDILRKPQQ